MARDRGADAVLLRLPIDRTGLHAIPLYTETTVVVIPKDHLLAAAEEVSAEELADAREAHLMLEHLQPQPKGKIVLTTAVEV